MVAFVAVRHREQRLQTEYRGAAPAARGAKRSPISANRAGTVRTVTSSGRTASSSSQRSGVDTVARPLERIEYADAIVRSLAIWL